MHPLLKYCKKKYWFWPSSLY